jgi:hypothetical protein
VRQRETDPEGATKQECQAYRVTEDTIGLASEIMLPRPTSISRCLTASLVDLAVPDLVRAAGNCPPSRRASWRAEGRQKSGGSVAGIGRSIYASFATTSRSPPASNRAEQAAHRRIRHAITRHQEPYQRVLKELEKTRLLKSNVHG